MREDEEWGKKSNVLIVEANFRDTVSLMQIGAKLTKILCAINVQRQKRNVLDAR